MKVEYCVIGLGRFGLQLARQLSSLDQKIMVIDCDEEKVNTAAREFDISIKCNTSDLISLKETGVQYTKTVIVAIPNIDISIMTCANLLELGVKNIIARASNFPHERILRTMNISNVIIPEIESANRLANQCVYNFGVKISSLSEKLYSLTTIVKNKELFGKIAIKLGLKEKFSANIIYIKRLDKIISPITTNTTIKENDEINLVVPKNNIQKIIKLFKK